MSLVKKRKGIIMAGGNGSRLTPITMAISKQLMPIYDKPMIYYPLSTLMMAGVQDILIITNPPFLNLFKNLLGDGSQWNIKITFITQKNANGLAHAFLLGEQFLNNHPSILILGDNIFHGSNLIKCLSDAYNQFEGATIFGYQVKDPERYGVVKFTSSNDVLSIEEKPLKTSSKYAVTGLYFYDETATNKAKKLKPSKRGELEITDLNNLYLKENNLKCKLLGRGYSWFDTGNVNSLNESSQYVQIIENRQGLKIGCPEEIAWRNKWINNNQLINLAERLSTSSYGNYLLGLLEN